MFQKRLPAFAENSNVFSPLAWSFLLLFLGMRSQPKDFPGLGFWRLVLFQHKTGVLQDLVPEKGHPQGIRRFRTWSSHHGFFGEPCKTWGVYICERLNATIFSKEIRCLAQKSAIFSFFVAPCNHFWQASIRVLPSSVPGPVPGPAGSHGETCNAPFAIGLGCGRAFGRKKRHIFFGGAFFKGCFSTALEHTPKPVATGYKGN